MVVDPAGAGDVWVTLLSDSAPCVNPGGPPLGGTSPPYTVEFPGKSAGSHQVLVETPPGGWKTLTINYPVASYDLRSERDGRSITVRAAASPNAVKVISWQLD